MSEYKVDKSVSATTVEKIKLTADEIKAWQKLMSITYNYAGNDPPQMDRTYFWRGSMEEQDQLYHK